VILALPSVLGYGRVAACACWTCPSLGAARILAAGKELRFVDVAGFAVADKGGWRVVVDFFLAMTLLVPDGMGASL
jgi:hypothetical protein